MHIIKLKLFLAKIWGFLLFLLKLAHKGDMHVRKI